MIQFSIELQLLDNLFNKTEILYNKGIKSVIEENFDGSFYGKIQRLRMYDIDLPFPEIKKNYNYFSNKYGFRKLK